MHAVTLRIVTEFNVNLITLNIRGVMIKFISNLRAILSLSKPFLSAFMQKKIIGRYFMKKFFV